MKIFYSLRKTASIIVCSLILGVVVALPASALTVTPPLSELDLTPGETLQTKIKLYNETDKTVVVYSEVTGFTAEGEDGNPSYDFDAERIGLSAWIEVPQTSISIEPGNSVEVPVKVNPPVGADPGGHYAVVFFSENPPSDGSQLAIGTKIGTLYLANVEGDILESGKIAEFLSGKKMYNRLPVDFVVRFQNTGNIHLRPTGDITISNMFGKIADSAEVNVAKSAVLPGQIRKYEAAWEKEVPQGTASGVWSTFWQEYLNEWNNFAFGKYSATATLSAQGLVAVQDTATVSFWVIPWHLFLVDGLGVLIILFGIIVAIKKYNSWIISKAGGVTKSK